MNWDYVRDTFRARVDVAIVVIIMTAVIMVGVEYRVRTYAVDRQTLSEQFEAAEHAREEAALQRQDIKTRLDNIEQELARIRTRVYELR